jgi:hypothetical protein
MRFFSKITCICNACFLVSILLRLLENAKRQKGNFNGVIKLQPLESTVVILGYGAIVVNFFFFIAALNYILSGRIKQLSLWIVLFNLVLFPIQIFYFLY